MSMPLVQLSMYEALTEAGVKPDAARQVERQVEAAIQAGQDAVRAEMREQLMTKADGESVLRAEIMTELHKLINDLTIEMFGAMLASTGIIVAVVIKLAQ